MSSSTFLFKFNRYKHLLISEWHQTKYTMLIVYGSIIGVMFLTLILQLFSSSRIDSPYNTESMASTLTIMAIIFGSLCFIELAKTPSRQNYLSIPASALEKLISKWTMMAIIIPISYIAFFSIFSWISPPIVQLFTAQDIIVKPLDFTMILEMLPPMILIQCIYILGSIWKPSYSIIKTTFSLFLLVISIGLITFLFVRVVYYDLFDGFVMNGNHISVKFPFEDLIQSKLFRYLIGIGIFLTIMAASLFKLREKEI
ncbi:MAG: hypothetical protein IPO62_09325 [Saprospiraceae bacterium]|nr:hypothetical protein [Saprospiraceae bacterium]